MSACRFAVIAGPGGRLMGEFRTALFMKLSEDIRGLPDGELDEMLGLLWMEIDYRRGLQKEFEVAEREAVRQDEEEAAKRADVDKALGCDLG